MTTESSLIPAPSDLLDPAAARIDGRVALVTGANGASGTPVARALAALGADVVLAHRGRQPQVRELADELRNGGSDVVEAVTDTSRPEGAAAAFDAAFDQFGQLDIVVHLAGAATGQPIADISDDQWRADVGANLDSAFWILREAARRLSDNGRVILLSTSLTAVTVPGYGGYAPHKAAVEHLVRAGAKELGGRGITVNAVAPGPLDSPFVHDDVPAEAIAHLEAFSPAGRLGTWDEIAPVIAFLATAQARWVSAQTIRVNGAMAG